MPNANLLTGKMLNILIKINGVLKGKKVALIELQHWSEICEM
jgi:hypothetical protein